MRGQRIIDTDADGARYVRMRYVMGNGAVVDVYRTGKGSMMEVYASEAARAAGEYPVHEWATDAPVRMVTRTVGTAGLRQGDIITADGRMVARGAYVYPFVAMYRGAAITDPDWRGEVLRPAYRCTVYVAPGARCGRDRGHTGNHRVTV